MNLTMQRKAAREFSTYWRGKGYEKGESQRFWIGLLQAIYGIDDATRYISFEDEVKLDKTSFIDAYIEKTHVMIEQKSSNKSLDKGIRQSDGSFLTPFQQAQRYSANLPYSKRPRWIITCNFKEFRVYDMEKPTGEPAKILLSDLSKEYYRLDFLIDEVNINVKKEEEISVQAGELVSKIYNELLKQYKDPNSSYSLKSINQLCVRLVFCLYAEDSGIFGRLNIFRDYLKDIEPSLLRSRIISLFKVLDTKTEDRDPYLDEKLAEFPYVNGGMFSDEDIEIPKFTPELKDLIVNQASDGFDWSDISPTIFGAVFESTLNPEARRSGGMHYTSIDNIHKVIDPLFLDEMKEQLQQIKSLKQPATIKKKAKEFQKSLSNLNFFDPACGSGNFLTETYISLRKIENELIKLIYGRESMLDTGQKLINVSIQQFYGIEINDFAVSVAKTALWIAESQMMEETKAIIYSDQDFLPLKSYSNIAEGNALTIDWNKIIDSSKIDFLISNPPFIGKKEQTKVQKEDLSNVFGPGSSRLDYVTGWYVKSLQFMYGTNIHAAFVSTNSITQGEQVPILWKKLLNMGIVIDFAHRTFNWKSEAQDEAHVHVVIIGFSYHGQSREKLLYFAENSLKKVTNITPYLSEGPTVLIENRSQPISHVNIMNYGSMPIDNGNLILNKDDYAELISENPNNKKFVRPYVGGTELLNNRERWCLWLKGVNPSEYSHSRFIMERIRKTKEFRECSGRDQTKQLADYPYLFGEIRQPENVTSLLVVPKVSSKSRKYIPISFVDSSSIVNGSTLVIRDATIFDFAILTSNIHMAWMRTVAGRMKSDYQYSNKIVYNNFPWPKITNFQREKIRKTGQAILEARNIYNDSTLANLYNELLMPPELRKAHQANDRAVMGAYGIPVKGTTESNAVAKLFDMYENIVTKKLNKN